jgi:predicted Rossmann fold nucleotide-binding protein DprA/Smf involved in DNA uptake
LLNWTDPEYPQSRLQIYDPPVLLYVRGDPQVLSLPSISIVGTCKPTLYGTQMAQRLGRELAARGLVVVSGLARGVHIDDIVERSSLNSSEVLATLFNLEMKGVVRQLPGKQFCKVLLWREIGPETPAQGLLAQLGKHPPGRQLHQMVGPAALRAMPER